MVGKLRKRLKAARKRLWDRVRRRHDAPRGSGKRAFLAKQVRKARRYKDRLARKLKRALRRPSLKRVNVRNAAGYPHWGGSGDVVAQFVEPFMNRRGLPTGSGKRTPAHNAAIGGSPYSDHLTTKTTTMARDFPTYSGEDDARALARKMGNGGWSANSYASFYFRCDGRLFRAQILWGSAIGHGDHVHVGVSRA